MAIFIFGSNVKFLLLNNSAPKIFERSFSCCKLPSVFEVLVLSPVFVVFGFVGVLVACKLLILSFNFFKKVKFRLSIIKVPENIYSLTNFAISLHFLKNLTQNLKNLNILYYLRKFHLNFYFTNRSFF